MKTSPFHASQAFLTSIDKVSEFLTDACKHYEKTAPTVAAHCDEMYIRISDGSPVTVREIISVLGLCAGEGWEHPNYAANRIYKLRESLKMGTTGHVGY